MINRAFWQVRIKSRFQGEILSSALKLNYHIFKVHLKLFVFLESEKIIHNTNNKIKLKMGNLINNFPFLR